MIVFVWESGWECFVWCECELVLVYTRSFVG